MSNYSFEYLQVLITRAVLDAQFRTDLLHDPLSTAKNQAQIDLTTTDGHLITLLASDIKRVSANQIVPEDAKNWSVGLLMTAVARICDQCWTLAFLDIPAKPHKPAFLNIPAKLSKVKNPGDDSGSP
jgi:hypothetical protein